jgi:hypothetical protein
MNKLQRGKITTFVARIEVTEGGGSQISQTVQLPYLCHGAHSPIVHVVSDYNVQDPRASCGVRVEFPERECAIPDHPHRPCARCAKTQAYRMRRA